MTAAFENQELAQPTYATIVRSHPGAVRERNEDAYLLSPENGLWAVCDGMGGHRYGDVASALVVAALRRSQPKAAPYLFLRDVTLAAVEAHHALQARADGARSMAATLVALLICDGHYACVWAGDSRAYRLRQGALEQITRDHSVVQELIDAGALTLESARTHPRAHVVTRALGMEGVFELDQTRAQLKRGDAFLLCSDGLTNVLSEREILAFLTRGAIEPACDEMLQEALARGAPDNVTFVFVRPHA